MRIRTIAAAVCAAALYASYLMAQEAKKPEADNDKPAAGKNFIPGIEQFMNLIQGEHLKLWFAARANNWELAAYQLGEIKEIMGDVQELYPKFKDLPFADMLDAVITGPIAELEKALDAKDGKKFMAGYDNLVTACNSCHQAAGNGFVVIQRPASNPFANQRFEPGKP
ncbi:MAG: hypothetical protein ACR2K5_09625 [Pseudolabrys sp.]